MEEKQDREDQNTQTWEDDLKGDPELRWLMIWAN